MEYLLDNAFLKIFPSPSNLHVQKRGILKKDMQYENYNERGFFFAFVSCWFFFAEFTILIWKFKRIQEFFRIYFQQ